MFHLLKLFYLFISLFSSLLLANDSYISLSLEPYKKTIFLFDQYYPHYITDISYMGIIIDGAMGFPLGNSMFHDLKIMLDENEKTKTQLTFLQDHSLKFYDTSIGIKSLIRNNIFLNSQIESKSYQRENFNQNILMNIFKKEDNFEIDFSYMYHYENIPTYYKNPSIETYNRTHEFFNGGVKLIYYSNNISLITKTNLQFSNTQYYSDTSFNSSIAWNEFQLIYRINNIINTYIQSDFKINLIENEYQTYEDNFNILSTGLIFDIKNKHYLNIGFDLYNKGIYPSFIYEYTLDNIKVNLISENKGFIKNNFIDSTFIFHPIENYYTNRKLSIIFENNYIKQSLSIGNTIVNINEANYYYILYTGSLTYKWFVGSYNLRYYDTNNLFIKNSANFSILISPKIKNKNFQIYVKLLGNYINLNNKYNIDFSTMNLFNITADESSENINIIDGEIGIIFKTFKLAFVRENIFNKLFAYTDEIFVNNPSNYLINIEWYFDE